MTQHILVPLDGSRSARKALEHACMMQRVDGGTLHLLHIIEPPPANDRLGMLTGSSAVNYTTTQGHAQGELLLKAAWSDIGTPSAQVEFHVDDNQLGRPDHTIVTLAEKLGVDAIVMGSRGLSDIKGLVVGSVSHKVSHVARCTVITLHVPDAGSDDTPGRAR